LIACLIRFKIRCCFLFLNKDHLHDLSPGPASAANPLDTTTQFMNDADAIARYLRLFAEDATFDLLTLVSTLSAAGRMVDVSEPIAATVLPPRKPAVVWRPEGALVKHCFQCLEKAGIPLFFQSARCMSAAGHFVRYGIFHRNRPI